MSWYWPNCWFYRDPLKDIEKPLKVDWDEPSTIDYRLWYALRPGIEQWAKRWGCVLEPDGFVYVLCKNDKVVEFDMNHAVSLAKEDRYDEIKEYVRERCNG